MKRIAVLFLAAMLLTGCASGKENQAAPETTVSAVSFEYPMPEGFRLEKFSDTEAEIISCDRQVGGIRLTPLDAQAVENYDNDAIVAYLAQSVPEGMEYEYMSGHGENSKTVDMSFIHYDPATQNIHEYSHTFFLQDGKCMDLWLDTELVTGVEECHILKESGIIPDLVFMETPPLLNLDVSALTLPEGASLTALTDTEYAVMMENRTVGFLTVTDLFPDRLCKDLDGDDARIDRMQYLERMTPEDMIGEFITMFCAQETDRPYLSVNYSEHAEGDSVRYEYLRLLFPYQDRVLDLTLDKSQLPEERINAFAPALGLE